MNRTNLVWNYIKRRGETDAVDVAIHFDISNSSACSVLAKSKDHYFRRVVGDRFLYKINPDNPTIDRKKKESYVAYELFPIIRLESI